MPEGLIGDIEQNLYSGKLSYGMYAKQFEQGIGDYVGNKRFIATTTFNYALLVVISALGLKAGDEIIASPVSCLASNQPFAIKALKITWVDIDPQTGTICLEDLKKKLHKNIKAVFVNYYCGYVSDAKGLFDLVKSFDIPLIDDAIEAFGSVYDNRIVGNLYADATVFSFQTVRLPNTIDGGGIAFNNDELYTKAILVRDYGIERSIFRDKNGEISDKCDISLEGYGALMSEVNAIIGGKQIPLLPELLERQRANAETWNNACSQISEIAPLSVVDKTIPNYWIYGILAKDKATTLLKFREKGFYATGVHINNNLYSVFGDNKQLKGVTEFMNSFIALPCGWWVTKEQIQALEW